MPRTLLISKENNLKERWINFIRELQDHICSQLEMEDGSAVFMSDKWSRDGGGGGDTRILQAGTVFEKAGVNTSTVFGTVTDTMRNQLKIDGDKWFACGLSLVIHPINPYVPTVHANWRYFELYDADGNIIDCWFGGGADLTPYYLFEDDASHFHHALKIAIDPFGTELYPMYKKNCDEYFINSHRNNEMRGIGGIFYDYLKPPDDTEAERLFQFQQANGHAFLKAYLPIVAKRKTTPYSTSEIEWQEIRRGRYVEFNLIHDRGTIFGLKTNGRTESILMSLPPRARWEYNHRPGKGTAEEKLIKVCLHPRSWA